MGTEIERKFIVDVNNSVFCNSTRKDIEQYYLSVSKDYEKRIRSINGDEFYVTIKTGGGLVRGETEYSINAEEFTALKMKAISCVKKTRFVFGRWEIDVYAPEHNLPSISEIEMKSEDEEIVVPDEIKIVEEVTEDSSYKNKNLALPCRGTIEVRGHRMSFFKNLVSGNKSACVAALASQRKANRGKGVDETFGKKVLFPINVWLNEDFPNEKCTMSIKGKIYKGYFLNQKTFDRIPDVDKFSNPGLDGWYVMPWVAIKKFKEGF